MQKQAIMRNWNTFDSTLQDCDGDDVMIETSLGFVEDLRMNHISMLKQENGQWEIGEQLEEAQMNAEETLKFLHEKSDSAFRIC